MAAKTFLIGVSELNLTDRGGRLTLLQSCATNVHSELARAQGDRTGGDDDDLLPTRMHRCHIFTQRLEPQTMKRAAALIDEQRGADLNNDPPRLGEPRRAQCF